MGTARTGDRVGATKFTPVLDRESVATMETFCLPSNSPKSCS
jgi:hypothetical protein